MYTFGPLIAKNSRSGRLLGGAPVTVTTLDGVTLTTAPAPLVTNHEGYLPAFTVDTDQRVILARPRGGDPLPLYAHEAIGDAAEAADTINTGRLSEDALKSTIGMEVAPIAARADEAHGRAVEAENAAKDYAGTLAYGTDLEATDAVVSGFAGDPTTDTGSRLGGTFQSVETAAATNVISNTVRRIVTSKTASITLADGDVLIPEPTPRALTDFHRTPVGEAPAGWTPRWAIGTEWEVVAYPETLSGKALRAQHITLDEYALSWMDDQTTLYADAELVMRCRTTASESTPRIVLRGSGTPGDASWNGFVAFVDFVNAQVRVARYWNGSWSAWGTATPIALGDWFTLRARIEGDLLTVKAWRDGEPEPEDWSYTRQMGFPPSAGTPLSEPGWAGLYMRRINSYVDWVGMALDGGHAPMPEVI